MAMDHPKISIITTVYKTGHYLPLTVQSILAQTFTDFELLLVDDLNDLAAMALCGFVACPADAAPEVKSRADYQCPQRGGEGAVRGAVEHILRTDGRWHDAVKAAFHVDV